MTDWHYTNTDNLDVNEMVRLRRLILVHSYLYYAIDESIVSDHMWQLWANELTKLQEKHGSEIGFYDRNFQHFNGSSGYYFVYDNDIINRARSLLRIHQNCLS